MSEYNVYRGTDIRTKTTGFVAGWGYVPLYELERATGLHRSELLRRFAALTKDLCRNPQVPVIHGNACGYLTVDFVPAGWARDMLSAWRAGVYFFEIEEVERITQEEWNGPLYAHAWNYTFAGWSCYVAFGYDQDGNPVNKV